MLKETLGKVVSVSCALFVISGCVECTCIESRMVWAEWINQHIKCAVRRYIVESPGAVWCQCTRCTRLGPNLIYISGWTDLLLLLFFFYICAVLLSGRHSSTLKLHWKQPGFAFPDCTQQVCLVHDDRRRFCWQESCTVSYTKRPAER